MERENKNVKLNFLKCFACIGVVFIHIMFPGMFGNIVSKISQYAVPVFFMIAGYYAYGKGQDVIKRRLLKIIKIFIYAYVLFFCYQIASVVKNHELISWFGQHFNWKTPIKYICFCTIDFAIPLWYLIAMIETYIVWLIVVRKGKEQFILKLLPILFVMQIILVSYCETMRLDWFLHINFITRAMPWFLLGYYLHTNKWEKLRNIRTYQLVVMIIVGCMIALAPTVFKLSFRFSIIGYIPYAFGLFMLALKNPTKSICKPLEFIGEKLSLNIYIFHVLMDKVMGTVLEHIFKVDIGTSLFLWCRPVIVLLCSIVASWIVYIFLNVINEKKVR